MIKEYGDWQQAKEFLDNLAEPNVFLDREDKEGISKNMPDILGYQVIYTKRNVKKSVRSFITIMNPKTNSCYVKNYSETVTSSSLF